MKLRSIRTRLTLWYTGLLTLTLLILGSVTYGLMVNSLSRDIDTALENIAQVLNQQAQREAPSLFSARVADNWRFSASRPSIASICSDRAPRLAALIPDLCPRPARANARSTHLKPWVPATTQTTGALIYSRS